MSRVALCKWRPNASDLKAAGSGASGSGFGASGADSSGGINSPESEFAPVAYTVQSLKELALHEPLDSVYTVDRTYPNLTVIKFDAHMDRLEDSARREGIPLRLDRVRFRDALRQFFLGTGFTLIRFRVAVARNDPGEFYFAAEEFFPPDPKLIDAGVACSILHGAARRNPAAKTADWMKERDRFEQPDWAYEGLLVDEEGRILEGATSNFYAVLDGRLRTAWDGVLPGIARQIVLDVAKAEMPIELVPIHMDQVSELSGCFLTSASRGIIPIVRIADTIIGDGRPSRLTERLRLAYVRWVTANLEAL